VPHKDASARIVARLSPPLALVRDRWKVHVARGSFVDSKSDSYWTSTIIAGTRKCHSPDISGRLPFFVFIVASKSQRTKESYDDATDSEMAN
jgi:hypothetical protein